MVGVSDGLSVGSTHDRHAWTERLVSLVALRGGSEIHATDGDIRRICDLFGLSVEAPPATARPSSTPTWPR